MNSKEAAQQTAHGGGSRRHYIDWLRVLAVLLLFPFHVSRVFNAGEPFYVKSPHVSMAVTNALSFISTWHMQLLFLLAGSSTYYALRRRSGGRYVVERVKRLLVPLVFGFLVLIPPQTWLGGRFNSAYTGSFWHYIWSGDWLAWNVRDGGDYFGGWGIGHLWFILILLLLSLVALPLLLFGRTARGGHALEKVAHALGHPAWWLAPPFVILLAEAAPDPGLSPIYYLSFFVLGYVIMGHGRFMAAAERHRWPALGAGIVLAVFWVFTGSLRDSMPDPSFQLFGLVYLGMMATWLILVGLLGVGKRYLDRPSPALSYLAEGSYPVYILHQTVIVVMGFYLLSLPVPGFVEWILLLAGAVAATFALYEGLRRVNLLRFLFGMRVVVRSRVDAQGEQPVRQQP